MNDVFTPASSSSQFSLTNRGLESNNAAVDLLTQSVVTPGGDRLSIPSRWMIQDTRCAKDVKKLSPYDFILHTYEGSHGYMDNSYLIALLRESFYEERRMMSDYRNVFRSGVDSLIDPVFAGSINRKSSSEIYDLFIKNCDNCGTSLHNLLKNAILHARLFDISFIVMDNLPLEITTGQSISSAINNRAFPYIYEKLPQEVHKWHTTPWGQLDSITFRDHIERTRGDNNTVQDVQFYRTWDMNGWRVYHEIANKEKPGEMVEVEDSLGTHSLEILPVIAILDFAATKNLTNFPNPSFYSIVNLCFALYNKESWIVTQEVHQGFPILCTSGFDTIQLNASPVNFINVPTDAKFPPTYAMPPQDGIKVLVDNAERLKDEIRHEFNQHGVEVTNAGSKQSGVSKEWDFQAKEVMLKNVAKATINTENAIVDMFKIYTHTEFTYECTYPDKFSPTEADDSIDRVLKCLKEMPPEPLQKYGWEKIAQALVLNDPEKLKELMDDLNTYFEEKETEPVMTEVQIPGVDQTPISDQTSTKVG